MGNVLSIIKNRFVSLLRTERMASGNGGIPPPTTTEMSGTDRAWNAARPYVNGPRQPLGNGRLADANLFLQLIAHANG